jgi:hypothetical protein
MRVSVCLQPDKRNIRSYFENFVSLMDKKWCLTNHKSFVFTVMYPNV